MSPRGDSRAGSGQRPLLRRKLQPRESDTRVPGALSSLVIDSFLPMQSVPGPSSRAEVIRAAGGIVWWRRERKVHLALVHRPKHGDWSLPKGKLEEGETWEQAALREVREETGCEARLLGFAGLVAYLAKGKPKLVMFWHMERLEEHCRQPTSEVDEVAWLSRSEALRRLSHAGERRLLNEVQSPLAPQRRKRAGGRA